MVGHAMDTAGTRILLVEGKVSDTIWHDALPFLKYPVSIAIAQWELFILSKPVEPVVIHGSDTSNVH